MSVQDAGKVIRDARKAAHLSQEQLSEGICTTLSLSRIENGSAGVSPSTFQALMARAGVYQEAFPTFTDRTDFECFRALKRAAFYLNCWQLSLAYEELDSVEKLNFSNNRFHYQEWLMLHCRLQLRSGSKEYDKIYETATKALQLSLPALSDSVLPKKLLSVTELWLLIIRAEAALYLGHVKNSITVSQALKNYIEKSSMSLRDEDDLISASIIVLCKCFFPFPIIRRD
jgi:transcriptional regulator with XRE-family HTH domain